MSIPTLAKIAHEKYANKTWLIPAGYWSDEYNSGRNIYINGGSIIKALGYITNEPERILWEVVKHVKNRPDDLDVRILQKLLEMTPPPKITLFPNVLQGPTPSTPIFVIKAYAHMNLEEVVPEMAVVPVTTTRISSKRVIPEWPHVCPRCKGEAYIGMFSVTCKNNCK